MPCRSTRSVSRSLGTTLPTLAMVFLFHTNSLAQQARNNDSSKALSPLLSNAFKKHPKTDPRLNDHFKRPNNQLMYWPNYPLTAWEIEQRDKKYDRSIGQQIASSIAESYVNYLLYGRNRKPVASIPKF
ncbi:MAG TPA: hypothetical protein PLH62_04600 [Ferruginibacter sp.]|nr:hypothetical protein [Ferruginibacter sp.]